MGRAPRLLLPLLAVAAAAAGCAAAGPLPPGWERGVRLGSPHFALETDLPEEDARAILGAAEGILAECGGLFRVPPDEVASRPVPLRVFADLWDYGRYYGLDLPRPPLRLTEIRRYEESSFHSMGPSVEVPAGHMRRFVPWGLPEIALPFGDDWLGSLRHEIAHLCTDHAVGSLPAWLNEGVAEYVRLAADAEGRRRAVRALRHDLDRGRAVPLPALVAMTEEQIASGSLPAYRSAWVLVRYALGTVRGASLADLHGLREAGLRAARERRLEDLVLPPE